MLEISDKRHVNFDHLRLEHLETSGFDLPLILQQQPRLRYIDFSSCLIDDDTFTAICELRNLEAAKMRVDLIMSCRVFESLKNLTHLKELQLKSREIHQCNHLPELSRMHLKIEKLTVLYNQEKIPPEFFIQLSQNFQKLKQIRIDDQPIIIINKILENLPNLESIVFGYHWPTEENTLVITENLRHEKLKEIVVTNIYDESADITKSLLTLLNACPNLERIMLSKLVEVYHEDLQQIINDHPKLTHLSLQFDAFDYDDETIDLIRTAASRFQFFELKGLDRLTYFQTESSLKDLFEDEFNNIRFKLFKDYTLNNDGDDDNFIYDGTLIMKKRNVPDWSQEIYESQLL